MSPLLPSHEVVACEVSISPPGCPVVRRVISTSTVIVAYWAQATELSSNLSAPEIVTHPLVRKYVAAGESLPAGLTSPCGRLRVTSSVAHHVTHQCHPYPILLPSGIEYGWRP